MNGQSSSQPNTKPMQPFAKWTLHDVPWSPLPNLRSPMTLNYIWLNGDFISFEDSPLSKAPELIESIRCYNTLRGPAVFRLKDHLQHFVTSARLLGIDDLGFSVNDLRDAVCRLVRVNDFVDCTIQPALHVEGPTASIPYPSRPAASIAAWRWPSFLGQEVLDNPLRVSLSPVSGAYTGDSGFDENIFLDSEGYVTGNSAEKLLLLHGNTIFTTSRTTNLAGITRDSMITLARDAGYTIVEQPLSRDQLFMADEILLCAPAAGVFSVREIDSHQVGGGQIGSQLQQLFFDTINGLNRHSLEWLDYMVLHPVV